ncbi:hypothetical protein MKEN_01406600 [Mycena kentingensis (nom. inval.)]|nr:hypothetical protein MKEN_01406600 [Mycena kentingensis (nom. inval.)]
MLLPTTTILYVSILFAYAIAQTLTVSVPTAAPAAAPTLDPSLFSMSIEQDTWTSWAGTTAPNTFLVNVLNNLKQRSALPWIRIGADSEDHTDFNPAVQFSQVVPVAPSAATPYPEASEIIVGDGFYQVAEHLPSGTHVVWGLPLLHNNVTAAFLEAKSIQKAFSSASMKAAGVTLEFIEIGNEPDLFIGKLNYTSANWNVSAFVDQWTVFATNLTNSGIVQAGSGPKYFGPSFAGVSHGATQFSPLGIFTEGILNSPAGALLKTYSSHHYQCGAGEILTDIVIKANVRSNLTQLSQDISLVRSKGLDYVLGETNSCFGHGAVNTSHVGGIAIWAADYTLLAGALGVTRTFFHQGIGYKYNAIQPVTLTRSITDASPLASPLPPHVQPAYHAALVTTEAIGTSGVTTAVELNISDAAVSGYAFYERGALKRAVLINHTMFFAGRGTTRGAKTVSLSVPGKTTVQLKRLSIPSADASTGLLWAGQSFDTADGLPSGSVVVESASTSAIRLSDSSHHPEFARRTTSSIRDIVPRVIAGAGGGFIASIATCPLDVVKTRLQAQRAVAGNTGYEGILDTVKSIGKHDGFRGYYRGLGPTILGYLPTWAIYFAVYDTIKTQFGEPPLGATPDEERLYPAAQVKGYQPVIREHPWGLHILSAMTAGAASTICTNPLWVIKTRFMTQSRQEVRYKHTLDAAMTIYRAEGMSAFYRGLVPSLLGISHVAVQFPLYEQLKLYAQGNSHTPLSMPSILLCSAIAKMTASIATYPHEVIRTRLQTQQRPLAESSDGMLMQRQRMERGGIVKTTQRLILTEGWKSLYKGLSVNLIRTVPNSAVTMLTYELLMRHLAP